MNRKLLYSVLLFLAVILFATSYCFAAENSMLENAAEDVRNMVEDAENTVENTMKNAADDVTNASKDATGTLENTMSDDTNNLTTDSNETMGITDSGSNGDGTTGYTASRTSADNTFMGMNSTTWIWLILAMAGIAIVGLVYYYSTQKTDNYRYDHYDE